MINIRPVSDLRNKYPEIEDLVLREDKEVYLTKNGYGSMVVMSLERYSQIIDELRIDKAMEEEFGCVDLEKVLEDAENDATNTNYYTHEEVFSNLRGIIDEKK